MAVKARFIAARQACRLKAMLLGFLLGVCAPGGGVHGAQSRAAVVAAASDLQFALKSIGAQFRAASGRDVKLVFGSSGNFYRQIEQGAPFDIFLSADEALVLRLAQRGLTEDAGTLYATGRLVLFARHGSPLALDGGVAALKSTVEAGAVRRFAIANPEHAPYGAAAEQSLRSLGVWEAIKDKLVLGENVSQAAQFATSPSAEGGMFAYSLALSRQVSARGKYILVPEALHRPLRQRMALIKNAGEPARAFYRYLQQAPARETLARYGFALPARAQR